MTKPTDIARLRGLLEGAIREYGAYESRKLVEAVPALLDELEVLRWQHDRFKSLSQMKRLDLQLKPVLEERKKLREFKTTAMQLFDEIYYQPCNRDYQDKCDCTRCEFLEKWSTADG
jgi:hypothetical protein